MVLSDYFGESEHILKRDTKEFLNKVAFSLLNTLAAKKIDTKEVELCGTNDIFVFRGTNVIIVTFLHYCATIKPVYSEFTLSEIISDESKLDNNEPILFESQVLLEFLRKKHYDCTNAVTVSFPISYFSLKDDELTEAHKRVAELLVDPAIEDVERKKRIVRVNPIYRGRNYLIEPDLCFVLMEFISPYNDIFNTLIKPTVEEEGFRCIKSDDIFSTTSVIEDIWSNINKAILIIAEISSHNPNVMYELGICHTVGKNVMMITQNPDEIPFNFRHMRCYPYKNDIPGFEELKRNIKSVVQHIRATSAP